jgi:translin
MMEMTLRKIIDGFQGELDERTEVHDEISSVTRKLIFYSKHGIMAIHRGDMAEAKSKITQMEQMRKRLEEILDLHRDAYTGSVRVAIQEYAEAHILLSLTEQNDYPDPRELKIPAISYILGLADSVGEFRRRALNSLLEGNLREAERCLNIMKEIYGELISLEKAYVLASELRRKCDIARRIIDATLGDVMMEARRSSLQKTVERLEEKIMGVKEGTNKA